MCESFDSQLPSLPLFPKSADQSSSTPFLLKSILMIRTTMNLDCIFQQRIIHPAVQECVMPSPFFGRSAGEACQPSLLHGAATAQRRRVEGGGAVRSNNCFLLHVTDERPSVCLLHPPRREKSTSCIICWLEVSRIGTLFVDAMSAAAAYIMTRK